ncbi:MAG TPA: hypothetical protein PKY09_08410 [Bacteroidia bacterium]|jgi:hypothetical protein|nr:hypothetical protein [Bacteroidia bacterium]HCI58133.1 hypothetical protein [Bacteroidota bacterium]HMU77364.1 hypothetical protein [Bacteroidia bacterium]HNB12918.1 hypothetical protein [Bacteroidia bacterium]HNF32293.1 hypothetical protein [Bacteroidia bacterium]
MFRKGIRFILSFVLIFSVLASASGITIFKMVCTKKNKTLVSLDQFNHCSNKENKECSFKRDCCQFSKSVIDANQLSNHENKVQVSTPAIVELPQLLENTSLSSVFLLNFSIQEQTIPFPPLLLLISKLSI